MISTSCGKALVVQSPEHAERNYGSFSRCSIACALLLLLGLLSRCDSTPLQSLSNLTLNANNSCIADLVPNGTFRFYPLDFDDCLGGDEGGWLNIELFLSDQAALTYPYIHIPLIQLMLDNTRRLPLSNTTLLGSGAKYPVFANIGHIQDDLNYTSISLPLSELDGNLPWFAIVSSYYLDLSFFLRAWCTARQGCANSCSEETERCVNVGTCTCVTSESNPKCETEVILVEPESGWSGDGLQDVAFEGEILPPGEWKYYTFETVDTNDRILIELSRNNGDLALFLKPRDESSVLPSESDFEKYADKWNFRNNFNYQYIYHQGGGSFFIGILNNDGCIQESSNYSLKVAVASPTYEGTLCPLNCSFPQGSCIKDGECDCNRGYVGETCDGDLMFAKLSEPLRFTAQLSPGQTNYYELNLETKAIQANLSLVFIYSGGHPILLGQAEGYPTLTNNTLKLFDTPAVENVTNSSYFEDIIPYDNSRFFLAVFNMDDAADSIFELIIFNKGALENAYKRFELKTILLAVFITLPIMCCPICVGARFIRLYCQRRRRRFNLQRQLGYMNDGITLTSNPTLLVQVSHVRQGLDKRVVETFTTISFQEDLKLQESTCAICLSEYIVGDVLRVIPICTHTFHLHCIDQWLQDHANCPVCRTVLH